jgi:hypothetical protein
MYVTHRIFAARTLEGLAVLPPSRSIAGPEAERVLNTLLFHVYWTVSLTDCSMNWSFLVWTITIQRPGGIMSGTLNLMAVAVCFRI